MMDIEELLTVLKKAGKKHDKATVDYALDQIESFYYDGRKAGYGHDEMMGEIETMVVKVLGPEAIGLIIKDGQHR
jgi:hypothetical protein